MIPPSDHTSPTGSYGRVSFLALASAAAAASAAAFAFLNWASTILSTDYPLAVIACENAINATTTWRGFIEAKLSEDSKSDLNKKARFANSAIDRIAPVQDADAGLVLFVVGMPCLANHRTGLRPQHMQRDRGCPSACKRGLVHMLKHDSPHDRSSSYIFSPLSGCPSSLYTSA
ncbi:hypothetical protein GQ44DRAFT_770465 [Phaeosphaeriaceae sp. PMI808]|nr:hypothetical protein GQ44DRAFT_770465 [Phaeosphaeriaceae sp. PMI808]